MVLVLRRATSLRGALEGVGPENRDFFGPWNGTNEDLCLPFLFLFHTHNPRSMCCILYTGHIMESLVWRIRNIPWKWKLWRGGKLTGPPSCRVGGGEQSRGGGGGGRLTWGAVKIPEAEGRTGHFHPSRNNLSRGKSRDYSTMFIHKCLCFLSAAVCSLEGRYDKWGYRTGPPGLQRLAESILWIYSWALKRLQIRAQAWTAGRTLDFPLSAESALGFPLCVLFLYAFTKYR